MSNGKISKGKMSKKMRGENERVRLRERVMEIGTSIHWHFHHFYLVTFALFSFSTFIFSAFFLFDIFPFDLFPAIQSFIFSCIYVWSTPSGCKHILFYKELEKQISYFSSFKSKKQNRPTFFYLCCKIY